MIIRDGFASAQKVKNTFLGVGNEYDAILNFYKEHNENVKASVVIGTYRTYCIAYNHLAKFLIIKYNNKDMRFREINDVFMNNFEDYLRYTVGLYGFICWLFLKL